MTSTPLRSITPTIDVYIKLAQYPILADRIRMRMREELFRRGVISQAEFEREVQDMAIESQRREGVSEPYTQEETDKWELRKMRIREVLTDAYFANSLGIALLEQIINEVLSQRPTQPESTDLTFNPEIAPWELLFRQGEIYEALPEPEGSLIRMSYFEGLSLAEAADRLGKSRSWACRLHGRILNQLGRSLNTLGITS